MLNSSDNQNDERVFARFLSHGPEEELAVLFGKYQSTIRAVAYRYLEDRDKAADLLMDVFEKLLRMRGSGVAVPVNFKAWLYTLVRNECLMLLRKEKRKQEHWEEVVEIYASPFMESEPDEHPVMEKQQGMLETCMQKLNEMQKNCIEQFYLQKKTYQEIITLFNYTFKEVKSAVQNGKRNLRICMEENT